MPTAIYSPPLFECGQLIISPFALMLAEQGNAPITALIDRHRRGDWGSVAEERRRTNVDNLLVGEGVVVSAYEISPTLRILVCTELDRLETAIVVSSTLNPTGEHTL